MRKTAQLRSPKTEVVRLMLHATENGVYLFGYDRLDDTECLWDLWYETVADAEATTLAEYDVAATDWVVISNPLEHCQQDWIAPVRIEGRAEGSPQWGSYEKLVDGQWIPFNSQH